MRNIFLGLTFLVAAPAPIIRAEETNKVLYGFATLSLIGLVQGIYLLAHEQKRKNDLQEKSLLQQANAAQATDPVKFFNTVEHIAQTHITILEKLIDLHKDDPSLQNKYRTMLAKESEIHQEISDALAWSKQLTKKQRKQLAQVQLHEFTEFDLKLLAIMKKCGYADIPHNVIDEIKKDEYVALQGNPHITFSKKFLKKLHQQSAKTA